jgi:hypothetical protein
MADRKYFPTEYLETHFITERPVAVWPDKFAIVTAQATTGQQWPKDANKAADQYLTEEIKNSGRWHLRITGYAPSTGYSEPGWAVEMFFQQACDLRHRYKQDTIYYGDRDIPLATYCEPHRRELVQIATCFRARLEA